LDCRLFISCAVFIWAVQPPRATGQLPANEEAKQNTGIDAAKQQQPDAFHPRSLPTWLKLGVEMRGRAESGSAFDTDLDGSLYLSRLRLNLEAEPASWIRIFVQGQDARVHSGTTGRDRSDLRNTVDLRQAYVSLGRSEVGWQLRLGRQELALGDERLVGADNYWDAFGQSFDALRLGFAGPRYRVDAFSGFRVQPARRRPDPFDTASRISGLSSQIKTPGQGVLEPYLLWKRGGETLDLLSRPGHRDVVTPGIRAQGTLRGNLDYSVEMAMQRGHVVSDRIEAWAGHWELGWRPLGTDLGPRLGFEYNFASGDNDPADGRHGTFDDLYPAGYNKCGMADPIAWRNIRYPALNVEMPVTRRWVVYGGYRLFHLASLHDGLYPGGDEYLIRNSAATSAEVGSHLLVSAGYVHSEHLRLYAGYGYLIPGAYLRESGYRAAIRTTYIQVSLSF